MKEYILKSALLELPLLRYAWVSVEALKDEINALPTTVHHEYKVGEIYEMSDNQKIWTRWILVWYLDNYNEFFKFIRPLQSEHPDITQARELLEKSWYSVTKI